MSWNLGGTLDELGLICPRAAQICIATPLFIQMLLGFLPTTPNPNLQPSGFLVM
jgi:hypothetical protein